jgi:hypothetical protein
MYRKEGVVQVKKTMILVAVAAVMTATTVTFANPAFHDSTENYYSSGGTRVFDHTHGTILNFGDVSGSVLIEVEEKGYYVGNDTLIQYTLINDNFDNPNTLGPDPLTSLHILGTQLPFAHSNGTLPNWHWVPPSGTEYGWETQVATSGVYNAVDASNDPNVTNSIDNMWVKFHGHLNITYTGVFFDYGSSNTQLTGNDWKISTVVPAPAGMVLCPLGLCLVGWLKRRFA